MQVISKPDITARSRSGYRLRTGSQGAPLGSLWCPKIGCFIPIWSGPYPFCSWMLCDEEASMVLLLRFPDHQIFKNPRCLKECGTTGGA